MNEDLQQLRSREEKFHSIDSQFLTEGLRLVNFFTSIFFAFVLRRLGIQRRESFLVA